MQADTNMENKKGNTEWFGDCKGISYSMFIQDHSMYQNVWGNIWFLFGVTNNTKRRRIKQPTTTDSEIIQYHQQWGNLCLSVCRSGHLDPQAYPL